MTDLFYPNGKRPPRRFFRREFEREVAKCEHWLTDVVSGFVELLFDDNYYDYAELYNYYLERFNSLVKYVNHRYKLSYCEVNQNYFVENFKPIENGN